MQLPVEVAAARLALLILHSSAGDGRSFPDSIRWGYPSITISTDEAISRLVGLSKPVLCSGWAGADLLEIVCRVLPPDGLSAQREVADITLDGIGPWLTAFAGGGERMLLSTAVLREVAACYVFEGVSWGITVRAQVSKDNVGADLTIGSAGSLQRLPP
ncbi:MAG: hypothetical protein IPJ95_00075 [Gemmatimonadetes bacterium]|nr:hypothetical protein [Gemmatimonadota bacterium]MBP6668904.1 hypothetical protein [Gemmatimonadales bacterium]MBK6779737.1 hypothetical protein [Gemmatimonadota bacterium]MBK7922033.1 hypothetical protein [Gemmatimonadota bacterium]MBK9065274.1 hypothetical protein [Gemmatimonadota bacterium]